MVLSTSINQQQSCLAQRKRAGLITRRTLDRNEQQLVDYLFAFFRSSWVDPFLVGTMQWKTCCRAVVGLLLILPVALATLQSFSADRVWQ